MYPLYPGSELTSRRTTEFWKAARFHSNGDWPQAAHTPDGAAHGPSISGRGCWDGDKAWESVAMMLMNSTGPNLFDTHPPEILDLPDRR